MIVGPSDTGKTTLAVRIVKQLLRKPEKKDQIVIISPNFERDPKLKELAAQSAQNQYRVKVYKSFDPKTIQMFIDYMDMCYRNENLRSVVYVDDPVGVGQFTSSVNKISPFNEFVSGIKHYNADLVFSTQATKSMSRAARANIDVFIFMPSILSRGDYYDLCPFVSSRQDFEKLMNHYVSLPFHAIWVNIQRGGRGVYRIDKHGSISPITTVPR